VIFDVAVDLRHSSPTLGQLVGAQLSADNHPQLWVQVGFAHGFLTLSEQAEVHDKASGYCSKSCERTLRWDDPEPMLAEKDASAPLLAEAVAAQEVFA